MQKLVLTKYQDYENVLNEILLLEILRELASFNMVTFLLIDFRSNFLYVLGKQAEIKKRHTRANQKHLYGQRAKSGLHILSSANHIFSCNVNRSHSTLIPYVLVLLMIISTS